MDEKEPENTWTNMVRCSGHRYHSGCIRAALPSQPHDMEVRSENILQNVLQRHSQDPGCLSEVFTAYRLHQMLIPRKVMQGPTPTSGRSPSVVGVILFMVKSLALKLRRPKAEVATAQSSVGLGKQMKNSNLKLNPRVTYTFVHKL